MIITTQKPLEEIMQYLRPFTDVLIIGCGTCATEVQTGGEKQVTELADKLRGRWFVDTMMIETPCDERLAKRDWRKIKKLEKDYGAVLVMACGAGIQTLSDIIEKPCFPGLDTHFLGKVERIGLYYERCKACGECYLGETAGICPITACHKGLINGPCGGTNNGKCEVDKEKDCAWTLIYQRLKEQDRLDLIRKYQPLKNHNVVPRPKITTIVPTTGGSDGVKVATEA